MNISKLEVGMIIKNYKELCNLLEVDVKVGKSKILQFQNFDRYFNYEKKGNSFIIKSINSEPTVKVDNRGKKGIYNDLFQFMFIHLLQKYDGQAIISKSKLKSYLGLINENYNKGYKNRTIIARDLNVSNEIVNDFFNLNNSNSNRLITNTIKSLENKRLIDAQECTMIKLYNKFEYRKASTVERDEILKLEKLALDYFGFKDIMSAKRSNSYVDYRKYRKDILKKYLNVEFTYKAYDIVFLKDYIPSEIEYLQNKIITELEYNESKQEVNTLYYNNSINNAIKRHKSPSANSLRSSDMYVELFKVMCDNFINFNFASLNSKIDDLDLEELLPF